MDAARLAELFHRAVLLPPAEQPAFFEEHCPDDPELRERLRLLLKADVEGDTLLEGGAAGSTAPRRIGRFTLLDLLGEGGMGTVYLARQDEPRRLVALKTVRVGTGSPEVAARLVTEFRALARMDHPSIARVFEAGTTESGLPWFAMEFVPGVPITEHCDRRRATIEERLALFQGVCEAVQHAHQKGIVHRDLKPENVLVAERDGIARPKLIDFGVLHAEGGELALESLDDTGMRAIGTLAYMSPEQAEPRKHGLDTRADVYALGVLLYELLAGAPPFDPARLAGLGPVQAVRTVLDEEPPAPSARVAALEERDAECVAAARGLTARALVQRLRGDLDWIVTRALKKDRTRRYPSASELAADLGRHLGDEPVTAWTPGARYRLRKFVRRHRTSVGALALLLLSGTLGLIGTSLGWSRARAEQARAEDELRETRYQVEKSQAFVEFVEYALTLSDAGPSGRHEPGVRELLRRSAPEIPALFAARPGAEAAAHHALGHFFLLLGDDELGLEQLLDAYRIRTGLLPADHADVFSTLTRLVQVTRRLGQREAEELHAREAQAMAQRIFAGRHPELSAQVARILDGNGGPDPDPTDELATVDAMLATLEGSATRSDGEVLARLLIEAGLQSAVGGEYFARLETTARENLGTGSLRYLVFLWKLANLALRPDRGDHALALRFARELRERAGAVFPRDHWLVEDSARVEGLALAGLWKSSGAGALLEQAEAKLWHACEVPPRANRPAGVRESEAARGFAQLPELLGSEEALRRWLAASWPLWRAAHARDPEAHTWWPATRPELSDRVREAALEVLAQDASEPEAERHTAFALARLGRAAEALARFSRLRTDADEDLLSLAFRVLCLQELERTSEAEAGLKELSARMEGQGQAPACEVRSLHAELQAER